MGTSQGGDASFDVIVVGGRVAGAVTATLLARTGRRVVVVDRARFPSPTLSTHFFRGDGLVRVLGAAGLLDDTTTFGAPRLTCEYSYEDGGSVAVVGPPQDPGSAGFCLSVRRVTLDGVLLDGARRAGARVLTSTGVRGLTTGDGRVSGVVLADGSRLVADLVVGADGRRSFVAETVAAADRERHPGARALYYQYVADMPGPSGGWPDGPEFSLRGDEMAYVFPSDGELMCVAVSVNLAEYRTMRHDVRSAFGRLLRGHQGIWDRYAAARPVSGVLGSGPQPDYIRQAAGPGWALVGDAGMHQDPWSGLGMDSAGIAAQALVASVDGTSGTDWADAYERRRDELLLDDFHETVHGAQDLSRLAG